MFALASVFEDRQVLVFVSIVSAVIITVVSVFLLNIVNPLLFAVALLALGAAIALFPRLVEFREYERGVLFRMGRIKGAIGPGWVWIFHFIDRYELVDLRVQSVDIKPQKVMSLDGVQITVDASINYRVKDPVRYVSSLKNISQALTLRSVSALRDSSARLAYQEILSGSESLNAHLVADVSANASDWGIEITLAEIESVQLPEALLDAMKQKEEALQKKDAVDAQADIQKIYLERLDEAAKKLSKETLAYLYVDAMRKMVLGKGGKLVIPYDLSNALPASVIRMGLEDGKS